MGVKVRPDFMLQGKESGFDKGSGFGLGVRAHSSGLGFMVGYGFRVRSKDSELEKSS